MKLLNFFISSTSRIVLSSFIIIFSLLYPFPNIIDKLIDKPLTDLLHFPIGFFGVVIISMLANKKNIPISTPFIGSFILIFACLTEFIQEFSGRSASLTDIHITFWGILSGIAYSEIYLGNTILKMRYYLLLFFSFLIGMLVSVPPILFGFKLYNERENYYPVLLAPNTNLAKLLIPVEFTYLETSPDKDCTVKVHTHPDNWSGAELHTANKDWSIFENLEINLSNTSEAQIEILIRIDDSDDSSEVNLRFGKSFSINSNETKNIIIPIKEITESVKGKDFNLKSVNRILIVNNQKLENLTFCINKIELK